MLNFTLLAVVILAGAAGDVSVTRGMKAVGEVSSFRPAYLLGVAARVLSTGWIWLGVLAKAIAFGGLLALLARADLSWVTPATAVSFLIETLAARFWLGEHVSPTRWAGAACVGLGVALISL
jgi:drug/metabolite transporter (DMT)-like permease